MNTFRIHQLKRLCLRQYVWGKLGTPEAPLRNHTGYQHFWAVFNSEFGIKAADLKGTVEYPRALAANVAKRYEALPGRASVIEKAFFETFHLDIGLIKTDGVWYVYSDDEDVSEALSVANERCLHICDLTELNIREWLELISRVFEPAILQDVIKYQ